MKEIKLAIVGFGGRGCSMFKLAINHFEKIRPVAICDNNPDCLKKTGEAFANIRKYSDFDEMLEKAEFDALLVETPATNHAEFCIKALRKNIHVMSDIPCIGSESDIKEFWETEQESNAIFMTGANPNMWAFVETAVDLKNKGLLGNPYYIECEYIHDIRYLFKATPWREKYECIKYCTHSLGPILRLVNENLKYVSCFDTGSHINKIEGQHDAMVAIFRTKSNVIVRLLCSFINNHPECFHSYKIYGTKGYFERTPPYPGGAKTFFYSSELYGNKQLIELPVSFERPEYKGKNLNHGGADYALFDHFFKAIRENLPSPISLKEGLSMSLPGIIAAESARQEGRLLKINYPWE